jgi:hypothetical protein
MSGAAGHFSKNLVSGLPLGADRQFLPSGGPAAGNDGAAIRSLHALSKSVSLRAVPVIRLVRTFRHFSSGNKDYTTGCAKYRAEGPVMTHPIS